MNKYKTEEWKSTHQPLLVTLEPFLVKPFHSNNNAGSRFRSIKRIFINPTLKHRPKTTFSKHTIGPEIPGGRFEISKTEAFQIGAL